MLDCVEGQKEAEKQLRERYGGGGGKTECVRTCRFTLLSSPFDPANLLKALDKVN